MEEDLVRQQDAAPSRGEPRECSSIWASAAPNHPWTSAQVHRATALELDRGHFEALAVVVQAASTVGANENAGLGARCGDRRQNTCDRQPLRTLDTNRSLAAQGSKHPVQDCSPRTPRKALARGLAADLADPLEGSPVRSPGLLSEGQESEAGGHRAQCRCCNVVMGAF